VKAIESRILTPRPVTLGKKGIPFVLLTVTSCYKHPEYRLPNTGFFTINIPPHRGMGHQESDAPILSISGAFF
jgi:hypothetical protein